MNARSIVQRIERLQTDEGVKRVDEADVLQPFVGPQRGVAIERLEELEALGVVERFRMGDRCLISLAHVANDHFVAR